MLKFRQIFRDHTLIFLYMLVFLLLIHGVLVISGTTYLGFLGIFIFSLLVTYVVLLKLGLKKRVENFSDKKSWTFKEERAEKMIYVLTAVTLISVAFHLIYLGGSPAIEAWSISNSDDVVKLRRSITKDAPSYVNYIGAFSIRAFLPFLVLYFLIKKKITLYYVVLIVGCFYAFSLMQKSYIINLLAPALMYNLLSKKYLYVLKYIGLIVVVVLGLSYTANPEFQQNEVSPEENPELVFEEDTSFVPYSTIEEAGSEESGVSKILRNLWTRVTIVPGEMVAKWFQTIPSRKPYLNGDGYRLLAKVKGSEFRNYSLELYPVLYPSYAKRGFQGSVNTASFMYDFANFGKMGLVLSGILLGLLFLLIEGLFGNTFKLKMSLNFYSILITSSAALSTTLLSGGWSLLIILYVLFLKPNGQQKEVKEV